MTIKDSLLKVFRLAEKKPAEYIAEPLAMKTTPEIKRIELKELEKDYYSNPVIFNSVNKITQIMMSTDFHIEAKSEKVKSFFNEFVDDIGYSGGELNWDDWLNVTFKHQIVYGRSWSELIHNKRGNKIVDLDFIDPKKMDYAKTTGQKIALDRQGNPIGYVEKIPFLDALEIEKRRRFKPPEGYNITLGADEIFFPPKRIAHMKLYTIGDGFYGIGLVEPIHDAARSKNEMQSALINAMWRAGFPTPVMKVGDVDHEPTTAQVKRAWDKLKKMNYKYGFTMPYHNELKFLEAKHPERLKEHLSYFIEQEITGMGIAKAFATGTGERGTNRAILNRQEYILKLTLRDIIKRTCRNIESQIFHRITKLHGFNETPRLKFGEVVLQELDAKASRLIGYAKAGLITPDADLERVTREAEDLPPKT